MAKPKPRFNRNIPSYPTAPKNVDWHQAFIDYCTRDIGTYTFPSYRVIAEKYGVAEHTVEVRAAREEWVKNREAIGKKKVDDYRANIKDLQDEANLRHGETWRLLQKSIRLEISDIVKAQMNLRGKIVPDADDLIKTKYLSSKLEELSKALKAAIEGERVTLLLYNDITKQDSTQTHHFETIDKSDIEAMDDFMAKNSKLIQNSSHSVQNDPKPNGQEAVQPQEAPAASNP